MIIKRVQVEEGFLHRLDLRLDFGLSVLIGARGSGKTSVIELLRFCLSAPTYSERAAEQSAKQAREVLGAGKVTVTIDVDGHEISLSRSADEQTARRSSERDFPPPIILSQSEIEQIGLHPESRLRLLDGFAPELRDVAASEDASQALIASLTVELREVAAQRESALQERHRLQSLVEELPEARTAAAEASADAEAAAEDRERLDLLTLQTATCGVRLDALAGAESELSRRLTAVAQVASPRPLDPWPAAAGPDDLLSAAREKLANASGLLADAENQLREALELARSIHQSEQAQHLQLEDEARTIRTRIEESSKGAGILLKRVSDLEAAQQRVSAVEERITQLDARFAELRVRRDQELDRLDEIRENRVNAREQAADFLNYRLGPKIRVTVNRYGSTDNYVEALTDSLRGSGLQYNILAPELASLISPRELADAAEKDDVEQLTTITGITRDRAQRLASHLREVGTETILTSTLGDSVTVSLLDGGQYKTTEELSVGQRCTAILPIVLTHTERVLVVDQPEDNLDNSFIADTLVRALRNRSAESQLILASHNPNIPVLGEADRVVLLSSDGKSGEVAHAGELDDPESVEAISDVMEGGREAFETRARFYAVEHTNEPS